MKLDKLSDRRSVILANVYMPCEDNPTSLAEHQTILSLLSITLEENAESTAIIGGDFNVDQINKHRKKRPLKLLQDFIQKEELISLSALRCSHSDYTFLSDDGAKQSNIDGFLVPEQMTQNVKEHTILYDIPLNTSDHVPVTIIWEPTFYRRYLSVGTHIPIEFPLHSDPSGESLIRPRILWNTAGDENIQELYTRPLEEIC